MNRLGRTTLAKALSEWGIREAVKYSIQLPTNEHERMLAGIDVVLQQFSNLAARIILAEPLDVLRVEFDREDGEELQLHNGHSLTSSLASLIAGEAATLDGPLFCTVHVDQHDLRELGPVVVYDGWHRAAKWLVCARSESGSRIVANLVKTKRPRVQLTTEEG